MDTKKEQEANWVQDLLHPLLEVLECIEILEIYIYGLDRMQFISNENGAAEPTWEYIIHISTLLEILLEKYPMIFGNYSEVAWKKYVKIGKALENGHWPFVYQLCWKLVSRAIIQIKRVVLDLLYFAHQ